MTFIQFNLCLVLFSFSCRIQKLALLLFTPLYERHSFRWAVQSLCSTCWRNLSSLSRVYFPCWSKESRDALDSLCWNVWCLLWYGFNTTHINNFATAAIMSRLLYLLHFCSLAPRYVLLNVHNLLHLVEDVNANGPLWCNSLFVFEDWNGDITDFFHGTQNVANQVIFLYYLRKT